MDFSQTTNLAPVKDGEGNVVTGTVLVSSTVYDPTFSKPVYQEDAEGHKTTYTLDAHGNVTAIVRDPADGGALIVSSVTYADSGSFHDLVKTTVDYDELGRYTGARVGENPQHIRYVYDWSAPRPRTRWRRPPFTISVP